MNRPLLHNCALAAIFATSVTNPSMADTEDDRSEPWEAILATEISPLYADDKHRAFDFWIGGWDVNWRQQRKGDFYHQKTGSWTHNEVFAALSGKALIEIAWSRDKPETASQRGLSIRYLDTRKNRWVMAQSWPNAGSMTWGMTDQLIGDVHHGRASMHSIQRGRAADGSRRTEHRRYNFTDIRPGRSLRWDGSDTIDHGRTWHTWAISEMHRTGDPAALGTAGQALPDVVNQLLCVDEPFGAMDFLAGTWRGEQTIGGSGSSARLWAGIIQDGCGIMAILDANDIRTLMVITYSNYHERWFIYRLDDQPGTTHSYFISEHAAEGALFGQAPSLVIQDEFTYFITAEGIQNRDPRRRLVWETMQEDRVVIREEMREAVNREWQILGRTTLTKQSE